MAPRRREPSRIRTTGSKASSAQFAHLSNRDTGTVFQSISLDPGMDGGAFWMDTQPIPHQAGWVHALPTSQGQSLPWCGDCGVQETKRRTTGRSAELFLPRWDSLRSCEVVRSRGRLYWSGAQNTVVRPEPALRPTAGLGVDRVRNQRTRQFNMNAMVLLFTSITPLHDLWPLILQNGDVLRAPHVGLGVLSPVFPSALAPNRRTGKGGRSTHTAQDSLSGWCFVEAPTSRVCRRAIFGGCAPVEQLRSHASSGRIWSESSSSGDGEDKVLACKAQWAKDTELLKLVEKQTVAGD